MTDSPSDPSDPVTDSPSDPDTPVTEAPDTDGAEDGDNESDSTMMIVIAVIAVAVVIVVGVGMYYMGLRSGKTPSSSGADATKSRSSKYGTEIEMDTTHT